MTYLMMSFFKSLKYSLDGMIYITRIVLRSTENVTFTYKAQQMLISIALNSQIGDIHAFTTIIGRCITLSRVMYYNSLGNDFPDNTECIRPAISEGKTYPGAELILTPPATPVPVTIDEVMVIRMQGEYKSHFPKENNDKQRS